MKVELGEFYINRGGALGKVTRYRGPSFHYAFDVQCGDKTYPVSDDGYFHSANEPHENDLVKASDA